VNGSTSACLAFGRDTAKRVGTRGAGLQSAERASSAKIAQAIFARWSRAGRRAITECITHRIDRSGRGAWRHVSSGLIAPPPRRLPHRANGEWTRSQEARPWENAGRRTPSTMHERASPLHREHGDRVVKVRGRAPSDPARERSSTARRLDSSRAQCALATDSEQVLIGLTVGRLERESC
jgi:hypothetical protein